MIFKKKKRDTDHLTPPAFINHTKELLARKLLQFSPAEIEWLEDTCETLSPDQPENLHEAFTTVDGIRRLNLPLKELEIRQRESGHAAAFHHVRNREALARKYSHISACLQTVLAQRLN